MGRPKGRRNGGRIVSLVEKPVPPMQAGSLPARVLLLIEPCFGACNGFVEREQELDWTTRIGPLLVEWVGLLWQITSAQWFKSRFASAAIQRTRLRLMTNR